jgi:hypothetical protein
MLALAACAIAANPAMAGESPAPALVQLSPPKGAASATDSASEIAPIPAVAHALEVELIPNRGEIIASDRLTLPEPARAVTFALHRDLQPQLVSAGRLSRIGAQGHLSLYRIEQPSPSAEINLDYHGRIRHPLQERSEGMGRTRQQSIGTIGRDGVFLTGFTGWYPRVEDSMKTFTLDVSLPAGWLAVSQGAGPGPEPAPAPAPIIGQTTDQAATPIAPTQRLQQALNTEPQGQPGSKPQDAQKAPIQVRWQEPHPQDEIYLIAAPFRLYRQQVAGVDIQAWLREADDDLARRYMAATEEYLARYSALIGDYPYAKFALVENFWETGYGMPSFTLLGPQVLRLPFILHSSYPHEILHNWWGNGVFVDWDSGNWSEGLTAYLADHLNKALAGEGAAYRHDQLKAYADYVRSESDIPLSEFRARHSQATQAIGYGKSLMVYHMLRQRLGDALFIDGLRRFYADNRFRHARWSDLQQAFEQVSDQDLDDFFTAWVQRPGAVRLSLEDVRSSRTQDGRHQVTGLVSQIQPEAPFPLRVPIVVHDAQGNPQEQWLDFAGARERDFAFTLDQPPLRLAVDPLFDTFRWLEPGETPVSLSTLFGAPRGTIVLPTRAAPELHEAYRQLASAWQQGQTQWSVVEDSELRELPTGPVWLLGWENGFLPAFSAEALDFRIDPKRAAVSLGGEVHQNQSPVLTRRMETSTGQAQVLGWLAADSPSAIAGLARKLPHYGKYGYLTFAGTAPTNQLKGQWPVHDSPLIKWLDHQAAGVSSPDEGTGTHSGKAWASGRTGVPALKPVKRHSLLMHSPSARQAP